MAKGKEDPKKKRSDAKKGGKKGAKAGKGEATVVSVANHPRARHQIRRAKGWGGLAGFVLAAVLSLKAGVPLVQTGERALGAGFAGFLVGWACSVTVWRALLVAELRAYAESRAERQPEGVVTVGARRSASPRS